MQEAKLLVRFECVFVEYRQFSKTSIPDLRGTLTELMILKLNSQVSDLAEFAVLATFFVR